MKFSDLLWEIVDNGLYVLHLIAILMVMLAAVACPIWLAMIHEEVVALREQVKPCECRREDGPGPVLPRVLPRVRRIGEGVEE
jgi:hypothetical protein